MPTEATFRFSTYLTLALACVALGYAQAPMLPEVPVFAGLTIAALGALYFIETRFALLSIPAANRLGAIVGTAFLLWAAYRIKRETNTATAEFASMGWHMLVVAMCGPLIMLLLAAKVARGEKHAGDYWTLHGTALAGVGLAAAFAEEPLCFALVGLYLVAAVWSLTLFHLNRAAGIVPAVPDPKAAPARTAAASAEPHGARSGFSPALLWAVVAGAVAVPLYLLTPRSAASKADFGKPRVEIGYGADQMVDLKRTGPLKANNETAFEVTATFPDGTPKTDLNPEQRWRGDTRRVYDNGEWKRTDGLLPNITATARAAPIWRAPELGTGQFTLTYTIQPTFRAVVLADPIVWRANQPVPVADVTDTGPHGWLPSPDGTFYWDPRQRGFGRASSRYVQAYHHGADPDLGPGFQLADTLLDDTLTQLRINPVERVKEYADKLVADLIASGEFPAEWRDPAKFRDPRRRLPREEHHDRIAKAFAAHLANNPELRYTTDLRRDKTTVDPIEDFLFHSKTGHCERFATALVLMLRSQGIPAVYVFGFKGCEHTGDGKYVVKQERAHAWVEALVSLPVPPDERFAGEPVRRHHWRSLDPTPGGSGTDGAAGWWQDANSWVGSQFREYVVNYTPEERRKKLAAFVDRAARRETLLALAAAIALFVGARVTLRRRAARAPEPPAHAAPTRWFGELIAVLAAHGIELLPGETALEFALRAADALRERANCAPAAEVPIAWANAYYQDRFGGAPPSDARLAELESELDRLRLALETRV